MKQTTLKNKLLTLVQHLPIVCCMLLAVFLVFHGNDISVDSILNYAPENLLFAAGFMLLLYAFKSLSVFFPLMVLKLTTGFLFPPLIAIAVNLMGLTVSLTVAYWIGRASGGTLIEKLSSKYPKLQEIIRRNEENRSLSAFFLRVIYILPLDVVSMYLGTTKMAFPKYLATSLLGVLPSTIAATLLGASITDPTSPMFWISIGLTIGFSAVSFSVYKMWEQKQ